MLAGGWQLYTEVGELFKSFCSFYTYMHLTSLLSSHSPDSLQPVSSVKRVGRQHWDPVCHSQGGQEGMGRPPVFPRDIPPALPVLQAAAPSPGPAEPFTANSTRSTECQENSTRSCKPKRGVLQPGALLPRNTSHSAPRAGPPGHQL